jgi:hypothetical protein
MTTAFSFLSRLREDELIGALLAPSIGLFAPLMIFFGPRRWWIAAVVSLAGFCSALLVLFRAYRRKDFKEAQRDQ